MNNKPLTINARVFDLESDKEESVRRFGLRKVKIDVYDYTSSEAIEAERKRQQDALDRKIKHIIDLIIWAANNRKSVEFILAEDDRE